MEIFGFLIGLGCLVLIIWAIALLSHAVFGRKPGQRKRSQEQPLSPLEVREPETSAPSLPVLPVSPCKVIVSNQPPVSTRVRLKSSRHQHYIRLATLVLEQLRSTEVQLPKAIAILRRMQYFSVKG